MLVVLPSGDDCIEIVLIGVFTYNITSFQTTVLLMATPMLIYYSHFSPTANHRPSQVRTKCM